LTEFEKIRYEVATTGVATITLDDPETRNALSDELLRELLAALRTAREDDAVRVVVLTSSHEKVFSAGANLAGFGSDAATAEKYYGIDSFIDVFKAIGELGKPSLVAANGHVLAGSLGIALACDLIVAKDTAGFGTPEINVGLFPFMIMALIYRNVGRKKTNEMLLLGERLTAEEAREAGIVNRVVPAAEFEAAVADWAQKLAAKSPLVMRLGKDAMWRQMDMPLVDALDYLRSQLVIELSTEDAIEGVTAFFEKREPEWKGR
jgi:enoyl-CoA hydratase